MLFFISSFLYLKRIWQREMEASQRNTFFGHQHNRATTQTHSECIRILSEKKIDIVNQRLWNGMMCFNMLLCIFSNDRAIAIPNSHNKAPLIRQSLAEKYASNKHTISVENFLLFGTIFLFLSFFSFASVLSFFIFLLRTRVFEPMKCPIRLNG